MQLVLFTLVDLDWFNGRSEGRCTSNYSCYYAGRPEEAEIGAAVLEDGVC